MEVATAAMMTKYKTHSTGAKPKLICAVPESGIFRVTWDSVLQYQHDSIIGEYYHSREVLISLA